MTKDSERFLRDLLNTPSPSGSEQAAARVWRDRLKGRVDEIIGDIQGNSIAVLNPAAPLKLMLAGHIDEIGLMITHIDDKGYLYTAQVGGMDPALLVGQRVTIMGHKGPVVGVVGRKAIHLMETEERNKPVKMENIWIDIGATDKKDALKAVSIGDVMVVDVEYRPLRHDKVIARGCDDKAGAFVVAEVLRELAGKKLNVSVIGVATVQEEIGLRGATTSAYALQPDAAIVVEVGHASDHPETDPKKKGEMTLGGGPVLNRGPNINPVLGGELIATARALRIPHQVLAEPRATSTDANVIQLARGGVATALVRIPNRYMHTPVEVISLTDLDLAVKLIAAYIIKLPRQKDFRP